MSPNRPLAVPAPLPSDRPVRWGIPATGKISATLVDEIRRTPDCEIVAVGSRTGEAARRFAAAHGIATAHGSYEALIEDDSVDVVYVGASHSAHWSAARRTASRSAGRCSARSRSPSTPPRPRSSSGGRAWPTSS